MVDSTYTPVNGLVWQKGGPIMCWLSRMSDLIKWKEKKTANMKKNDNQSSQIDEWNE